MPILGGLITSIFSSFIAFFTLYVSRKVAFALAAVAAMTTITAAFYLVIRGIVAGLNSQVVGLPDFWAMILSISVPPAAPFCFASYATVWGACTLYAMQKNLLNIVVKV